MSRRYDRQYNRRNKTHVTIEGLFGFVVWLCFLSACTGFLCAFAIWGIKP